MWLVVCLLCPSRLVERVFVFVWQINRVQTHAHHEPDYECSGLCSIGIVLKNLQSHSFRTSNAVARSHTAIEDTHTSEHVCVRKRTQRAKETYGEYMTKQEMEWQRIRLTGLAFNHSVRNPFSWVECVASLKPRLSCSFPWLASNGKQKRTIS